MCRRRRLLLASVVLLLAGADPARALLVGGFGPNGESGLDNGFLFNLGSGGQVQDLDAFVAVGGLDLNGPAAGTAAQLSIDPLPAALAFDFSAALYGSGGILLTYELENVSGAAVDDLVFLSFLDAEVVETTNTFFNEHAEVSGSAAPGQGHEVDEPGFVFGDLFANLLSGALDDSNALPSGSPDDVAMALSFAFPTLAPGARARIDVLISEAGESLSGIVLTQLDPDNPTTITYSGRARLIPEPATATLLGLAWAWLMVGRRDRRRCV